MFNSLGILNCENSLRTNDSRPLYLKVVLSTYDSPFADVTKSISW
ncbi:Uncharacterised protein [Vibrio cholerae]|nr:Uncharacterised protein [Vibrio cholerae]